MKAKSTIYCIVCSKVMNDGSVSLNECSKAWNEDSKSRIWLSNHKFVSLHRNAARLAPRSLKVCITM